MSEPSNPELHVNENPRNDFIDVAMGMAVTTVVFFLLAIVATIIGIFV